MNRIKRRPKGFPLRFEIVKAFIPRILATIVGVGLISRTLIKRLRTEKTAMTKSERKQSRKLASEKALLTRERRSKGSSLKL